MGVHLRRLRVMTLAAACVAAVHLSAAPARAQSVAVDPVSAPGINSGESTQPGESSGFRRFLHDVAHDYRNMLSVENAQWAAAGAPFVLAIHQADGWLSPDTGAGSATVGSTYGNLTLQMPLAIGWWAIGHAMGSPRGADAGRDLVRAQVSAVSWTYALKYAAQRTRPNGDPRSFPSGHASATFATATVLEAHYGWKVGLPAYVAATYTAAERVRANKHWASDVAAGAVLGMLSARTVTIHIRAERVRISANAIPAGAQVTLHVLR